jgi:hypothetical protein
MSLFAALLVASAQPAPAAQPESATVTVADRQLLDAFRSVCDMVTDWEQLRQAAAAGGWSAVEESSHPQLARINQVARGSAGNEGRLQLQSFARTDRPAPYYLVLSRFENQQGRWGNSCRIYDLAAARPLDPSYLAVWMGRPPTGRQSFSGFGSNLLWEPGWREGLTVSVNHVPATSAFRERYGLSGNVLVAQALGGN